MPRRLPRRRPAGADPRAVATAALAVIGSFLGYAYLNRNSWFFYDDWDFVLNRPLTHDTMHSLFAPHNEHWSTLPVVYYRVLYSLTGMHHYLVFELPVLAVHAASCVLLWLLMRRAGATPWATTCGVVLVSVCGGGAENLSWDFQIGFVSSVFFGLLALLIVETDTFTRRRLVCTWAALLGSLMSSGVGVPMVVATGTYAWLRHSRRTAAGTLSVPVAALALWYLTYGQHSTTNDTTTTTARLQSAQYIWDGLTNAWQVNTGMPNSGTLIFLAITVPLLGYGLRDRLGKLAIALLTAAVVMFAIAAWARVRFGASEATQSRYVYICTVLTVVGLVWSGSMLVRRVRQRQPEQPPVPLVAGIAVATALTIVTMASYAQHFADGHKRAALASKTSVLSTAALLRQGADLLRCCPDSSYNRLITVAALSRPGVLAALPPYSMTPAQEIAARGETQVDVRAAGGVRAPSASYNVTLTSTGTSLRDGAAACVTGVADARHPVVVDDTAGRASVSIDAANALSTRLRYAGLTSPPSTWHGDGVRTVAVSQPGAALLVYPQATAEVTVCR